MYRFFSAGQAARSAAALDAIPYTPLSTRSNHPYALKRRIESVFGPVPMARSAAGLVLPVTRRQQAMRMAFSR